MGELKMKRLCDFYIQHAGLIGAIFCIIPTLAWFIGMFITIPFREVYLLRIGLCLVFGSAIAAYLNRYGVETWLCKHRMTVSEVADLMNIPQSQVSRAVKELRERKLVRLLNPKARKGRLY
jgi:DNA-binding transcriptional ArsR family regulator